MEHRRQQNPMWSLQAILDDIVLLYETQRHKAIVNQKYVCGSTHDVSRIWIEKNAKGIVVCHNCKTHWYKAWNRNDIAKKDRSVRKRFFDQWSAYRIAEASIEGKGKAFQFHEVYKNCMRCGELATTHPEDWCPDARSFDLCQSCKDACGTWKATLKGSSTTDKMRNWLGSYRPKVAEDIVCACCGGAANGKGPKSHPDENVRYCNACRIRGRTWVNGRARANKPCGNSAGVDAHPSDIILHFDRHFGSKYSHGNTLEYSFFMRTAPFENLEFLYLWCESLRMRRREGASRL
jgi:hypothetical protein